MADVAHLDARPVVLQRVLEATLDIAVVALLLHVDEVDDDQARKVAQTQLAGNFISRLEIGAQGGVFDVVFARRPAGVDVDRHQRFRLVDHHVAARGQGDGGRIEAVELAFRLIAREQRTWLLVELHVLRMARHKHLHEVLGFTIGVIALDDHLVDILGVEVADGALDEAAFLIDEGRGLRLQGQVAHALPQAQQVVIVALDFGLGALGPCRAHDEAHALRHFDFLHHVLEAAAVAGLGDLARDAAAARGVRHQYAIAPGEREIGGQRRTLVAALFLDDLHQDHLAALDDFLDLVLLALHLAAALRHFFQRILGANRFHRRGFRVFAHFLDAIAEFGRHAVAECRSATLRSRIAAGGRLARLFRLVVFRELWHVVADGHRFGAARAVIALVVIRIVGLDGRHGVRLGGLFR